LNSTALRIAFVTLACLIGLAIAWFAAQTSSLGDFRAFYCAGSTVRHGADPYLVEPLHVCEIAVTGKAAGAVRPGMVIPAPVPPYVIAFLAAFSVLPFKWAAVIWTFALIVSVVASGAALLRLTDLSPVVIISALLLSVLGTSMTIGQIAPFAIALICVAALCVHRGWWIAAAIASAAAMIEPNVGLPVCLSVALWLPRARAALLACGVVMAAISFSFGAVANLEYFHNVLPAHALSEIASDEQYSISVILQKFGIGPPMAIIAGTAWYCAMVFAGVILARIVSGRLRESAFYVFLPPALAVIGGTFIHITQIAAAIPAALLFLDREKPRHFAYLSVLLLALPWPMAQSPVFAALAALLAFATAYSIFDRNVAFSLALALATACGSLALTHAYRVERPAPINTRATVAIDSRLAEAPWARLMLVSNSKGDAVSWLKRAPTWGGLILLCVAVIISVRRESATGRDLNDRPALRSNNRPNLREFRRAPVKQHTDAVNLTGEHGDAVRRGDVDRER
jgi:hypothetical protein